VYPMLIWQVPMIAALAGKMWALWLDNEHVHDLLERGLFRRQGAKKSCNVGLRTPYL